jgi:Ser/Thr protein kinase RdoA (MazF antagonist)
MVLAAHPYETLTPQRVLDALADVGLYGDGRILQLNSYENRVFQLFLEDGRAVVAKFYRPGRWSDEQILEEHALALELVAAEVPVVPPLVLSAGGFGSPPTLARFEVDGVVHRLAVSPRCAGREPELEDDATLLQIGRFLGRLHMVGAARPFAHRHRMQPEADATRARQLLIEGGFVSGDMLPAWSTTSAAAIEAIAAAFASTPPSRLLRLHGDCHLGNVLWRDGQPNLVDLDDACTGPAVQDFWMLVSGDRRSMAWQLSLLLEGYAQFRDFDTRELALIEPLRTLRMLRHSAWLAERWSDPAFPLSFPFFGTAAYWSQQVTQLREQLEAMAEPPLNV